MTQTLDTLLAVASDYDATVFDQWGVLHDGTKPYSRAIETLEALQKAKHRCAVLSNSGKRAAPNAMRIAEMGFDASCFETVMTSGEALWQDIAKGTVPTTRFFAIERSAGDAAAWAEGLDITLEASLKTAEAVLLMGLSDGSTLADWSDVISQISERTLPVFCSNPDRASPRAGGQTVVSPGALAFALKDAGADVTFYGKPHLPIFAALQNQLSAKRVLMVGDSLEHDIAGGHGAGWDTLLIKGGLYAKVFKDGADADVLARLQQEKSAPAPTYLIEDLR